MSEPPSMPGVHRNNPPPHQVLAVPLSSGDSPSGLNMTTQKSSPEVKFQLSRASVRAARAVTPVTAWMLTVSWYSKAAIIIEMLSLLTFLVAFATPYWEMTHDDETYNTYSGLWRFCFHSYICDDFINHDVHGWFRLVQIMTSLGLLSQIAAVILTVLHIVLPSVNKNRKTFILPAFICMLFDAIIITLACIIYTAKQGSDQGSLAWSLYIAFTSSILMVVSSILLGLEYRRLNKNKALDQKPILRHSASVDSFSSSKSSSPDGVQNLPARERSNSEVRMRVNSMSCLVSPPAPIPSEGHSEYASFGYDSVAYSPGN